jgi:hypothetical protein
MLEFQEGGCAACKTHHSNCTKAFAVDHEHARGFIRGLVCDICNRLIGQYEAGTLTSTSTYRYGMIAEYVLNEGIAYPFRV